MEKVYSRSLIKLFLMVLFANSSCDYCENHVYNVEYKGIVVDKNVLKYNKNDHIIVVMDGDKKYTITTFYKDTMYFYKNINLGDSVIKKKFSTAFTIKSKSGVESTHEFICNYSEND